MRVGACGWSDVMVAHHGGARGWELEGEERCRSCAWSAMVECEDRARRSVSVESGSVRVDHERGAREWGERVDREGVSRGWSVREELVGEV